MLNDCWIEYFGSGDSLCFRLPVAWVRTRNDGFSSSKMSRQRQMDQVFKDLRRDVVELNGFELEGGRVGVEAIVASLLRSLLDCSASVGTKLCEGEALSFVRELLLVWSVIFIFFFLNCFTFRFFPLVTEQSGVGICTSVF